MNDDANGGIDRRTLLATAAAATLSGGASAATAEPVVEVKDGKLGGTDEAGISVFRGIPYGASTAGHNRFLPPQQVQPWTGVRDAKRYQGHAPQAPGDRRRPELADFSGTPDTTPESEDCLTLNVWTPALTGKRPVMVWFHGGAFSYGSANGQRTQGNSLARRGDVVVVSVNQRLNIFGHLYLAEIGGAEFAESGNAGTLDMVAALKWVRENISQFGGDSGSVTIFGESGGGGKVSTLLGMPAAQGLFHRAIIQSGAAVRLIDKDRANRLAEAVLKTLDLGPTQLDQLQMVPVAKMLAAIAPASNAIGPTEHKLFDRYNFGPVVDGRTLPNQPFDPVAPQISADIPLIIGDMKDEMAIFLAPDDKIWNRTLTEAELHSRVAAVAGADTDRVIELYKRLHPETNPAELLIAILTDSNFRVRSLTLAQRKAALGRAPVYMYSFEWETPVHGGRLKAPHAMDVPFTFDTLDLVGSTDRSPAAYQLAARMSATWAAFAHTGSPDNPAIPHWPSYNAQTRETMMLNTNWSVVADPNGDTRLLWQQIAHVES
jgi:para-nitrobenzyl esterase